MTILTASMGLYKHQHVTKLKAGTKVTTKTSDISANLRQITDKLPNMHTCMQWL